MCGALGLKTTSKVSTLSRFENSAFLNIWNFENLAQTDQKLRCVDLSGTAGLTLARPSWGRAAFHEFASDSWSSFSFSRVILFLAGVEYLSPLWSKTICKCWPRIC